VGNSIFVDGAGNAYVTGSTKSSPTINGFPATAGAYQTIFGGTTDAFVVELTQSAVPPGGNTVSNSGGGGGCFVATASAYEPRK
ncbi:MAG TPA: SBBP repeat-containing protein, partial [Syntrophobacteria bacterium]|nr:SBBP repeat-containing protein [Syntrophobacteria bacterium]